MDTFFAMLGLLLLVVVFAWLARRLLGAQQVSTGRTLLAAVAGFIAAALIGEALRRARDLSNDTVLVVTAVLALVFTMVALVILEMLMQPGWRRGLPRPRNPVKTWGDWYAKTRRSAEVTGIAVRHGFGNQLGLREEEAATLTNREIGRRMRSGMEEAGGMFVKFGQLLATRQDLVPPEVAEELAVLHQDTAPAPRAAMEQVLVAELGRSPDEIFADFDWTPIGSASIGQVYRAILQDGASVAVKIRRPGVEQTIERDLAIVIDLARYTEARTDWGADFAIGDLAEQFAADLRAELDYRIEARNMAEIAAALADDPSIDVPRVYPELSTSALLVMEYVDAVTLSRNGPVGGPEGTNLADALVRAEIRSMIDGQRFHTDPHPGNIMLPPGGGLVLIDCGAAQRLDAFERAAVADVLTAISQRDPALLREAALTIGEPRRQIDTTQLDRALARLLAEHLGPGSQPSAQMLDDFLALVYRFGLSMSPSVTSLFRALGTLQGSLELLSPGYELIGAARDLADEELDRQLTPENLVDEAKREVIRVAPLLRRTPYHLDRIAGQMGRGRFTVQVSLFSRPDDVVVLTSIANRAILAFIGAALGIVSAMLFAVDSGPLLQRHVDLFDVLGFIGLFAGAALVMRVVLEVFRDREPP